MKLGPRHISMQSGLQEQCQITLNTDTKEALMVDIDKRRHLAVPSLMQDIYLKM